MERRDRIDGELGPTIDDINPEELPRLAAPSRDCPMKPLKGDSQRPAYRHALSGRDDREPKVLRRRSDRAATRSSPRSS
jgi:hypothetical protein